MALAAEADHHDPLPRCSRQTRSRTTEATEHTLDRFVKVRGAREHNLKNVDVDIPRDALVVFSGVSGSGKSSLAFSTLYAEAQRRYFDSVAPYARRLIEQVGVPAVDSIDGLPPAVALQQQRGTPGTRSSVGSLTTLSNLLRMLYSRAGHYPARQPMLYAEDFSPNTPQGACPTCHGLGHMYDVTEKSMVPDDSLSIRERAIASWPPAWHGQNLRDILVTLGYDVDRPWRDLPRKDRNWILFTDEQPTVPVYAGFTPAETRAALRRKDGAELPGHIHRCAQVRAADFRHHAERADEEARLAVHDRHCLPRLSWQAAEARGAVGDVCRLRHRRPVADAARQGRGGAQAGRRGPRGAGKRQLDSQPVRVAQGDRAARRRRRIGAPGSAGRAAHARAFRREAAGGAAHRRRHAGPGGDVAQSRPRLPFARSQHADAVAGRAAAPAPGHADPLQPLRRRLRARRAVGRTCIRSTARRCCAALEHLKRSGNTLFVVEHDLELMRHADWIVDVGPDAGEGGGEILYSGPPDGLRRVEASHTARYLYGKVKAAARKPRDAERAGCGSKPSAATTCTASMQRFPLGVLTTVTGVSGSGKSSLVSQALVELVSAHLGHEAPLPDEEVDELHAPPGGATAGRIVAGAESIGRLVRVDQKPIGRTPRSNLATYTGLFDQVRRLFAATPAARSRRYDAGRFSFNVAKGRCETCEGEGFVSVELLFMPSVYAPCPSCHGARYNPQTLKVTLRDRNIAEVLAMTVDEARRVLRRRARGTPAAAAAARHRPRLPAPGAAGHRAVGRRGTAHQARDGAAALAARQLALRARRAHHRPSSGRCRPADGATERAGGQRQYGDPGGA